MASSQACEFHVILENKGLGFDNDSCPLSICRKTLEKYLIGQDLRGEGIGKMELLAED